MQRENPSVKGNQSAIEKQVNGCLVILHFASRSVDGVLGNVQSILSNAYDERIQKEIKELISAGNV